MASGVQAAIRPTAATWATLFTASTGIVINVSATNRASSADDVTIAVVPSGESRAAQHEIEAGVSVASSSVIERTGIVLGAGDSIHVNSQGGDVAFVCWGVELA